MSDRAHDHESLLDRVEHPTVPDACRPQAAQTADQLLAFALRIDRNSFEGPSGCFSKRARKSEQLLSGATSEPKLMQVLARASPRPTYEVVPPGRLPRSRGDPRAFRCRRGSRASWITSNSSGDMSTAAGRPFRVISTCLCEAPTSSSRSLSSARARVNGILFVTGTSLYIITYMPMYKLPYTLAWRPCATIW